MKEKNNKKSDSQESERAEYNSTQNETRALEDDHIPTFGMLRAENMFQNTELLSDYVGQELIIYGLEAGEGKYGPFIILNAKVANNPRLLRTSSRVIIDQVNTFKDRFPYRAKVIEKAGSNGNRYISFS